MGDVQSTQRGSRQDAAAEEENRDVDNPQTEQNTKHQTFKNLEQSSDISRKGEEVKINGCHEDENGAQGLPLIPTKEAAPETQVKEEESQGDVDVNDGVHLDITELDVKQNDFNSLGRFFSNIGLKLTINRGSGGKVGDDNKETNTEESEETKTEKAEDKSEGEAEQDSSDPTAVASENVLEDADKTAATTEEPGLKAEAEPEPHSTNPTAPADVEIDSPIRRFFATGIFAGLWKKKETGDETTEKELEEMGEDQVPETTGQTAQERRDEEPTAPGELRDEIPAKAPEPDILASQESDRVQTSPLLRFLSGSSLKRLSTKQRNIKSSDARLGDSGEGPAELLPSEPAEDRRNASAPTSAEAAKEEESAWASFKRFMSPKPRMRKSCDSAEETPQPASVEEPRAAQTSDHSSEEGKKRKNSSVSWEAVLCGSGRRRSRKTSDSEDEMPPIDLKYHKEDGKPQSGEESGAENEKGTASTKLDGSQEEDGGSTWKSLKRIVTPKRKSRDEDEARKIKIQSGGEGGQENSSFSIKNLLPGRKKQRSEESQGCLSDEAEKDPASDDEDSETPAVVPLSEFEVDEEENRSLEEMLELQQDQGAGVDLCFLQDFDEGSEKQDPHEGAGDVTELAVKHQQLSDIPEEGVITETWATLASAVTAAEPAADLTLHDETEMFTAASHFSSESAATSGNATPVPAERHIDEMDTLLHQVAERFSTSPQTAAPEPEQPFEGCVKESTILEMYRRPDATSAETGLNGEDLEAPGGLTSASLTDGVSEVAEFKSVGFGSEVAIEGFDSTDHTEVEDEERPSAEEERVLDLAKELAEAFASEGGNETGEKEIREAGDETLRLTAANVGAEDAKQVPEPEIEGPVEDLGPSLEPDVIFANISMCLGTETGGEKPELETCLLTKVILEQLDAKSVEEPADLQTDQASSLSRQQGSTSSQEPQMISENLARGETAKDETQVLSETDESAEAPQEPDVSQAVQELSPNLEVSILSLETELASSQTSKEIGVSDNTVKLQELNDDTGLTKDRQLVEASKTVEEAQLSQAASSLASDKGNETSVETEQKADDVPKEETVVEESKKESIITKDALESEEASTISEEPEAMKVVWPPASGSEEENVPPAEAQIIVKAALDTEEDKIQTKLMTENASEPLTGAKNICMAFHPRPEESEHLSLVKEAACDHVSEEEPVADKPKQETILNDTKLQSLDPSETVQEAEVSQVLQQLLKSVEPEIPSEIILTEEAVPDELHSEITLKPEDPSETDREAEVLMDVHPQSLESEETKEEPSDNIPKEETVPGEPRDQTTGAGGTSIDPVDDSKTEVVEELETVQTSSILLEESSRSTLTAEETSEKIPKAELDTVENQVEAVLVVVEASEATPAEEPELSQIVQVSSLESEDNSVPSAEPEITSEIILTEETIPDEPGDETTAAGGTNIESVDDSKTAEVEELETVETSSLVREEISISPYEPEETSENTESDKDENKAETILHTEYPTESEDAARVPKEELKSLLQAEGQTLIKDETAADEPEDVKRVVTESLFETVDDFKTSQMSSLESEEHSIPLSGPEASYQNDLKADLDPDTHKTQTTIITEDTPEPPHDPQNVEEAELSPTVQPSSEETEKIHVSSLEAEEISEKTLQTETVPHESVKEIKLGPEDLETVGELQSEHHSLVKEVTRDDASGEEPVPGDHKQETILSDTTPQSVDPSETVQEAEVSQVLQQSLESEETKEEPSDNISEEETVPGEPRGETTVAGETSSEPVDKSKPVEVVEELETVQTSSLVSEKSSRSTLTAEETSEKIPKVELDTVENQVEAVLVVVEASEAKPAEEPELSQTVQVSSLESEDNSIPSAEPDITSEIILTEETVPDELHNEITLKPEDPSETDGEAEVLKDVHPQSLESEETKEEPSDNISEEETVPGEPRDEATAARGTSSESVDESKTAEVVEELETVEISSLVSEKRSRSTLTAEETSENIQRADTDTDECKVETVLDTEDPEIPQTVQTSPGQSEDNGVPSAEPEITSEIILTEETVPDEPGDETTAAGGTNIESVDDSKTAEVEELETVETSSLVREESSISPYEPEETSENTESDKDENKAETILHTEYPTESEDAAKVPKEPEELKSLLQAEGQTLIKEETAADEPEDVKRVVTESLSETVDDFKTSQMSSLESEEHSIPPSGPEASSQNDLKADLDPDTHETQTTFITEDTPESPHDPQNVEEAELSPTVQPSSEETEKIHVSSLEAEEISENTLQTETVPHESVKEDLETIGELQSEHHSLVKEVTRDDASGEEPVPGDSKQETILSDTTPQSVDPSETERADSDTDERKVETVLDTEEPEIPQTVQSSPGQSEDNSVPSAEPEITSEIILTEETVSEEPKEELKLHSEITLEPEDPSETYGEAEGLKDVHPQSLESEESRGQSSEGEVTSDNISEEPTDKPRDEITAAGGTSSDPEDDSKTAEVVEELETVKTSSTMLEESSRSTLTAEETSEKIPKVELDTVENQVEAVLAVVEASEAKPAEEPELSQTVQVSSLESEDNSVPSAEPDITSEIILTEETVPDEPGDETTAVSEAICGQETAEDVKESPVQTSSQEEYKSLSPPPEAEEASDISKAETVSDETKEETTFDPEDTESADESGASRALKPIPGSEHPSLDKEATSAHISGEEMVPGEHKEEPTNETLELIQDLLVPSSDSGELEVKSNNAAEAETDTVPLPEGCFKPEDIQEAEVLRQAASFESVEASDERQVTPENIPRAEPEEEHLTVETTNDLKTEQVKDDKCSGTETEGVEGEVPAGEHMDKCHPQDVSEEAPDVLREQSSEAEEGVKEKVEAATPSVRDGAAEEVKEGKAEEVAVVDAGTRSGTTVDSLLEVEGVMDVCCSVVHAVENVTARTEPEKEQILAKDEATAQEEKEQVDDQVEEKESTTVQATEASQRTRAREVDQDEWMDAEEHIDIQEETAGSFYEAEEPLGRQEDVDQAGLKREAQTASRTEGRGSGETKKADEACGFESEEEDFEVAPEQPGSSSMAAASLTG